MTSMINEAAIEKKMEDPTEFVRWWGDVVQAANRPKTVAERGQLSVEQAQDHTSITKQQVSKWRHTPPRVLRAPHSAFSPPAALGESPGPRSRHSGPLARPGVRS